MRSPELASEGARMFTVVKAALAYTLPVFAVAFVLGALRVTLVAPVTGPFLAVALEVPAVLAVSWIIAGRIRFPPGFPQHLAVALVSFVLLMVLEVLTALAFGQSPMQFFTAISTPAGALGLAGQVGFALLPLLRHPRG